MSRFGEELVRSAREALAIAQGELEPGRVHLFGDGEARRVHAAHGLPTERVEEPGTPAPSDGVEPDRPAGPQEDHGTA